MIRTADLRAIATARLADAQALLAAGRHDWALYTCGYAVECSLKARTADTLDWTGFPSTKKEFEGLLSFKTHDLGMRLKLSGAERQVKANHPADWSEVVQWDPEARYKVVGAVPVVAAQNMVAAATRLLAVL